MSATKEENSHGDAEATENNTKEFLFFSAISASPWLIRPFLSAAGMR